jgi:uncharacterized protein (DUF305 family)
MRRIAAAACALLLGGALIGCGAAPPAGDEFNETDVMFLQMMVPHHHQGIAIVQIGSSRSSRSEVAMLAAAIESTQAAEADTMAAWLRGWGQPAAADPAAHAAHGGMPGTSEAEITALREAGRDAFEGAFLNTLIAHQDDAVQLARMQTSGGINPRVRDLAQRIDRSRTAQISQMLALLRHHPNPSSIMTCSS